jgi:pilus assembly protein Flp/PilA
MLTKYYTKAVSLMKSEKGQTLVEYGLILALVAIVVLAVLGIMGNQINNIFSKVTGSLSTAGS